LDVLDDYIVQIKGCPILCKNGTITPKFPIIPKNNENRFDEAANPAYSSPERFECFERLEADMVASARILRIPFARASERPLSSASLESVQHPRLSFTRDRFDRDRAEEMPRAI
jgi:hypothetical protein